jgi:hypothetical protein
MCYNRRENRKITPESEERVKNTLIKEGFLPHSKWTGELRIVYNGGGTRQIKREEYLKYK